APRAVVAIQPPPPSASRRTAQSRPMKMMNSPTETHRDHARTDPSRRRSRVRVTLPGTVIDPDYGLRVSLDWPHALAWRMRQQLLDPVGTESVAGVVRRLGGIRALPET